MGKKGDPTGYVWVPKQNYVAVRQIAPTLTNRFVMGWGGQVNHADTLMVRMDRRDGVCFKPQRVLNSFVVR